MAWSELVTCALLGTERQTPPAMNAANALEQLLEQLDGEDREGSLLRAAGAIATWQRAGQVLTRDQSPLPPSCEADTIPCCSQLAGEHLALMLQGYNKDFLQEWLELLGANHQRVPEGILPTLLDYGAEQKELHSVIVPVLGQRGRWLARFQSDWSYAADRTDDEDSWQTGRFQERLTLLRRLRATQPEQGLELLASTWGKELVRHRREFIATLAEGLSNTDEPFLEAALDDRNKEVVSTAVDLLSRLPDSRLVQRMTERAFALLRFQKGGLLKRGVVEVELPEDDPALQRDGIIKKPPAFRNIGDKAWRLSQIIGTVPPNVWCQQWELTPEKILTASRKTEWKQMLVRGLALATIRHRDPDWATILLPLHTNDDELTAPLAEILPPEKLETYLLSQLEKSSSGRAATLTILRHLERPWSLELSRAVLKKIRERVAEDKKPDWQLAGAFNDFARWIPAELSEEVATGWSTTAKNWMQWEESVNIFIDRIRFRQKMREALADSV